MKPVLIGCATTTLSDEEKRAFAAIDPFGFILFARNVESEAQLQALTTSLREITGRDDTPIFVDEEGGRVARLRGPEWPRLCSMGQIGALYEKDHALGQEAMALHINLTSHKLRACGLNGNCAPVLDIHYDGASLVMGDRTFGSALTTITTLGRQAIDGYLANGILPVIKHMPGHGRVKVDPHETLPFVDATFAELEEGEFRPFMVLKDAPLAMNCHVIFRAIDPDYPVSLSAKAHSEILRGKLGYEGLLLSDDLFMGAISIPLEQRGIKALQAGADIALYGTGNLENTLTICADLPPMPQISVDRWDKARNRLKNGFQSFDLKEGYDRLTKLVQA